MTAPAKQDSSTSATPTFYQLLQFDARGLWAKIRATEVPREKRRYFLAMVVRSLLLVAFAILFIGVLTAVFGNENSGVVVAGFCILLGIKFVSYGYRVDDSLFALAVVFACMLVGGLVTLAGSPALSFIANLLLVAVILVLVANDPPMGNAGIYVFGYLFVSQTPVTGAALGLAPCSCCCCGSCAARSLSTNTMPSSRTSASHICCRPLAWQARSRAGSSGWPWAWRERCW